MRAESKTKAQKPHPRHPLVLAKPGNIFLSAVASCSGAAVLAAFSPTSILSMRSAVGPVLAPPSASAPWFASLDVNALPSECILRQVPLAISNVYSTIYCDWDRWCQHMYCKHTDICWCSCSFETKWGSSPKQAVPISLSLPLEDATETNQEFPFYKITDLQNPWPKCSFKASRKLAVQPDFFWHQHHDEYGKSLYRNWKCQPKVPPTWRCEKQMRKKNGRIKTFLVHFRGTNPLGLWFCKEATSYDNLFRGECTKYPL